MKTNNVIVALDVGTSKTVALVGDIDELGDLTIIGYGEAETKGIDKGLISNPNDVIRSIKEALVQVSNSSGVKISSVIANLGGFHIEFRNEADFLSFGTTQKDITDFDISTLSQKVKEKIEEEQHKLIHIIPKRFILDDENEVVEPVNCLASKLEGEFHIILTKLNTYSNLKRVIEMTGVKVADFIANIVASATSTIFDEEKEMGVLPIDIGGGTTDYTVIGPNSYEYTASLPLGGNNITLDISHRFKIPKKDAEKIKVEYGLATLEALENEKEIEVYPIGSEQPIYISHYELVDTIEARLEQIFTLVKEDLEKAQVFEKVNGGVVLTGGVANTPYIKDLAYNIFKADVRIGKPTNYKGFSDKINSPQYATAVGIMLFKKNSFKQIEFDMMENIGSDFVGIVKKILDKIKSIF